MNARVVDMKMPGVVAFANRWRTCLRFTVKLSLSVVHRR